MQTPWGDIEVADAHVHFLSWNFYSALARQKGEGTGVEAMLENLPIPIPPHDPAEFGRQWAAELDRHGVARACLIASVPGDEDSVAAALVACPGRFHGYFFVNPLRKDAVERLGRAFAAGLRGVCLFPAMFCFSMGSPEVAAIVERTAAQPGAILFVHCGVLAVGIRRRLGLNSPFDMRYSNPLMLHHLALQHPGLPFVLPHFGAGLFREALMLADLCPNVFLDTSSSNTWTKYLCPPPTLEQVFERALAVAGPQRLLFGTDSSVFPRGWHKEIFDRQVETMLKLNVSTEDTTAFFGGNLNRILSEVR
jgi:predicted TIM-barrel fold metal-dependent hydrolase